VAIVAVGRRVRAVARLAVAVIVGASLAIIAGGDLFTLACCRIADIECTGISVVRTNNGIVHALARWFGADLRCAQITWRARDRCVDTVSRLRVACVVGTSETVVTVHNGRVEARVGTRVPRTRVGGASVVVIAEWRAGAIEGHWVAGDIVAVLRDTERRVNAANAVRVTRVDGTWVRVVTCSGGIGAVVADKGVDARQAG